MRVCVEVGARRLPRCPCRSHPAAQRARLHPASCRSAVAGPTAWSATACCDAPSAGRTPASAATESASPATVSARRCCCHFALPLGVDLGTAALRAPPPLLGEPANGPRCALPPAAKLGQCENCQHNHRVCDSCLIKPFPGEYEALHAGEFPYPLYRHKGSAPLCRHAGAARAGRPVASADCGSRSLLGCAPPHSNRARSASAPQDLPH